MVFVNHEVTLSDILRDARLIIEILGLDTSVSKRETLIKSFNTMFEYKSQEDCFNRVFQAMLEISSPPLTRAEREDFATTSLIMVEILNPKLSTKRRETLVKHLDVTTTQLKRELANIMAP